MTNAPKERLVVISNGMAGARVVEEILARDPDRFVITIFGSEPDGNYNHILLSNVLNGSQKWRTSSSIPSPGLRKTTFSFTVHVTKTFLRLTMGGQLPNRPSGRCHVFFCRLKDEAVWATGMPV